MTKTPRSSHHVRAIVLTQIKTRQINSTYRQLVEPFQATVFLNERPYQITVPTGFTFDGSSIPRALRPIFGQPFGTAANQMAGCLHDYLYRVETVPVTDPEGREVLLNRRQADQVFQQFQREYGTGPLKGWLMYLALRSFGGTAYQRSFGHFHNRIPRKIRQQGRLRVLANK